MGRLAVGIAVFLLTLALPMIGQVQESIDLDALYRIKDEGLQRSQAMDVLSYLTDVYGADEAFVTGTFAGGIFLLMDMFEKYWTGKPLFETREAAPLK